MITEGTIYSILKKISKNERTVQILKVAMKAKMVDRWISIAKTKRNIILIPSSAGTTETARDANSSPSFIAMKINAMMIVEGSVPRIPPIFVP